MELSRIEAGVPCVPFELAWADSEAIWIDLRSPGEYAKDHVPGALSAPLFDDLERALIGTLYAQRSPQVAFEEGRARTMARIGDLVADIARLADWKIPSVDLSKLVESMTAGGIGRLEEELVGKPVEVLPERPVILSCWRGGLRSRSVVALLRGLGLERAVALEGGYRSYRRRVRERLETWRSPPVFVLRGLTGVGKTLVLRALEELRPGLTLDLEGLAGHRSSILGMVGLSPCSQKTFDSRLVQRLELGFPRQLVVEGESRKVGDVTQPACVWDAIQEGTNIRLVASTEYRVSVLIDDYLARPENRRELRERLPFIEERLGGGSWAGTLVELLDHERDAELVEVLLERYYDPLYRGSEGKRPYAVEIEADPPHEAAAAVLAWIEAQG